MYLEWTQHLTDEKDKEKFRNSVLSAKHILDRLKTIIEKKEKALDRSEMSIEAYSAPNWSERQAHKNGNRQALAEIKTLVDLDIQRLPTGE